MDKSNKPVKQSLTQIKPTQADTLKIKAISNSLAKIAKEAESVKKMPPVSLPPAKAKGLNSK